MNASVPPPYMKAAKPYYRRLDTAYGCFAFIVLATCLAPLVSILPLTEDDKGGLVFVLGLPIAFVALVSSIAGLVLSVVHRREWPLGAMAVATVVFLLMLISGEKLNAKAPLVAAVLYLAVLAFFCGRWFFFIRRKRKQTEVS